MSDQRWEEIEVPRGAYIGWGNREGQHVTGKVLNYDEKGGSDVNGDPVPSLEVELTEKAASFNKEGDRNDFDPGEFVVLNASQANLKRGIRAAALNPGDLVKITLVDFEKTAKGKVKIFAIKVARGAGKSAAPAPAKSAAGDPWAGHDEAPRPPRISEPVDTEPPF